MVISCSKEQRRLSFTSSTQLIKRIRQHDTLKQQKVRYRDTNGLRS